MKLAIFDRHTAILPLSSDDLSTIIAMLTAGLTDQAIMRQLEISTRTMRRRMASIYERLNAGTRFHAGYNAAASDSGRVSRS